MVESYKTLYLGGQGEIIEKKSRFIANIHPAETEEEALHFLETIRRKYYDARHNCFAYSIGVDMPLLRCSDDGEPNGTAGKPLLEVINGIELRNTIVVVTRYFGGTLLGTGGLVRAYTHAAQSGICNSTIIEKKLAKRFSLTTNYTDAGKVQYILASSDIYVEDTEYTDQVILKVLVPVGEIGALNKKLTEATSARILIEEQTERYYAATKEHGILIFER